jgi:hypothetical protein
LITAKQAAETVERYNVFVKRVEELDLIPAIDAKPLLDVRLRLFVP